MANIKDHVIYEDVIDQLGQGEGGESLPVQYGEANDGANVGDQGVGPYDGKTGVTLNFRNIAPASSKVSVTHDVPGKNILLDFVTGALEHQDLNGAGTFTHADIDAYLNLMAELAAETRERTGFENRTESAMSFNDLTRVFTIAPVGGNFVFYQNDVKYNKASADTITLPNVTGLYLIYYDVGVLGYIQDPNAGQLDEAIRRKVLVAYIYYNQPAQEQVYLGEERHQFMPNTTHSNLHFTRGTQYLSGGALTDFIVDGNGSLDTHAQFQTDSSQLTDEDLFLQLGTVIKSTSLPVIYQTGPEASSTVYRKTPDGFPIMTAGTGRMAYNQLTGGNWQLTEVTNNKFALTHVILSNDLNYEGPLAIAGQAQYDTIAEAREGALNEVNSLVTQGLVAQEFVFAGTVIYQTADSYSNAVKSRVRSTLLGDDYIDWRGSGINPLPGPGPSTPASEIFRVHHTGLLAGGELTVNADPTKFDLEGGNGVIIDYTDPNNPAKTEVSWDSAAAISVTAIATNDITAVFIDNSGLVVQKTSPVELDYRDKIFLGLLVHVDRVNVDDTVNAPSLGYDGVADFRARTAELINFTGNVYEANSTNLTIKRSSGSLYHEGINFHTSTQVPSVKATGAETPSTFGRWYVNSSGELVEESAAVTSIDPAYYNNTTTGTLVAVTANRWSIQRIHITAKGETFVMYGQEDFATVDDALAVLGAEDFITPPLVSILGVYRYALVVRGGATDLSLDTDAVFKEITATGGLGGGGGGGGVTVHNDLTLIQGGTATERYHLEQDEHDDLTSFNSVTEKTSPAPSDIVLIEDSDSSYVKKKVSLANLPQPQYAVFTDEKTNGTNAGGSTSASWVQRDLNTTVVANTSIATLSSNQITLPQSGKYMFRIEAPGNAVDRHRVRLYNVSDTTTEEYGMSAMCGYVWEETQTLATMVAYVNQTATSKTYRIDHWCARTVASYGLGKAASSGAAERYTTVEVIRLGPAAVS
jgi:hypothetical protein